MTRIKDWSNKVTALEDDDCLIADNNSSNTKIIEYKDLKNQLQDNTLNVYYRRDGASPMVDGYVPTNDQDLVTKKFMTDSENGFVTIPQLSTVEINDPVNPQNIATKHYVDNHVPDLTGYVKIGQDYNITNTAYPNKIFTFSDGNYKSNFYAGKLELINGSDTFSIDTSTGYIQYKEFSIDQLAGHISYGSNVGGTMNVLDMMHRTFNTSSAVDLTKDGTIITKGDLNNVLINDPVNDQNIATKHYVDSHAIPDVDNFMKINDNKAITNFSGTVFNYNHVATSTHLGLTTQGMTFTNVSEGTVGQLILDGFAGLQYNINGAYNNSIVINNEGNIVRNHEIGNNITVLNLRDRTIDDSLMSTDNPNTIILKKNFDSLTGDFLKLKGSYTGINTSDTALTFTDTNGEALSFKPSQIQLSNPATNSNCYVHDNGFLSTNLYNGSYEESYYEAIGINYSKDLDETDINFLTRQITGTNSQVDLTNDATMLVKGDLSKVLISDPVNPQNIATKNYVDTHGGGSPPDLTDYFKAGETYTVNMNQTYSFAKITPEISLTNGTQNTKLNYYGAQFTKDDKILYIGNNGAIQFNTATDVVILDILKQEFTRSTPLVNIVDETIMTKGDLSKVLISDPVNPQNIATKNYVDINRGIKLNNDYTVSTSAQKIFKVTDSNNQSLELSTMDVNLTNSHGNIAIKGMGNQIEIYTNSGHQFIISSIGFMMTPDINNVNNYAMWDTTTRTISEFGIDNSTSMVDETIILKKDLDAHSAKFVTKEELDSHVTAKMTRQINININSSSETDLQELRELLMELNNIQEN